MPRWRMLQNWEVIFWHSNGSCKNKRSSEFPNWKLSTIPAEFSFTPLYLYFMYGQKLSQVIYFLSMIQRWPFSSMSLFICQETNPPELVIEQVLKSNTEVLSAKWSFLTGKYLCSWYFHHSAMDPAKFSSWDTGKKSRNGTPLANSKHARFIEILELVYKIE